MPLAEQVTVMHAHPRAPLVTTVGLPGATLTSRTLPRLMPRVRRPLQRVVEFLPPGPPAALRRRDRAHVLVVASGQHRTTAFHAELRDTYGLTARFLVEAALRIEGRGAMTPSQALGAEAFLDAVSGDDESGSFAWFRAGGVAR
jgi:short subunit dehydrogenase-like uncharacterized protein